MVMVVKRTRTQFGKRV